MQQTHVGKGIFLTRSVDPAALAKLPSLPPKEIVVQAVDVRDAYEALGGRFVVHEKPHELRPGVWITGPIPRVHPERNWTAFNKILEDGTVVDDTIPEDRICGVRMDLLKSHALSYAVVLLPAHPLVRLAVPGSAVQTDDQLLCALVDLESALAEQRQLVTAKAVERCREPVCIDKLQELR